MSKRLPQNSFKIIFENVLNKLLFAKYEKGLIDAEDWSPRRSLGVLKGLNSCMGL